MKKSNLIRATFSTIDFKARGLMGVPFESISCFIAIPEDFELSQLC
jgi:hypothetical protein